MRVSRTMKAPLIGLGLSAILCLLTIAIAIVCIEAGANPGSLENVYIAKMNLTHFGQDLIPELYEKITDDPTIVNDWIDLNQEQEKKFLLARELARRDFFDDAQDFWDDATDSASDFIDEAKDKFGEAWDQLSDFAKEMVSKVVGKLDEIMDDIMGDIADSLGIPDYFSLHMKSVCEYDADDEQAALQCSDAEIGYGVNLDEALDEELSIAGYKVPLRDFLGEDVEEDFSKADDAISVFVTAICVFYIIGACAAAGAFLAILYQIFQVFKKTKISKLWTLVGFVFALISFIFLVVGSACTTAIASVANDKLGDIKDLLNIYITRGETFTGLTWTMVAAMAIVMAIFAWLFFRSRKAGKTRDKGHEMEERAGSR